MGVPAITQVEGVKLSPFGSAPPEVIEQVVVAPPLVTVGAIDMADPPVPVTELGIMLMVGAAVLTLRETVVDPVPAEFVALMV